MDYRVLITPDAENLLNDFELTLENLERVAGSLRYCDNPWLSELGYKKIHLHQKLRTYNIALEMARKKLVC